MKAVSYKNGLIFHIWPELHFQTEYLIFTLEKKFLNFNFFEIFQDFRFVQI